MFITCTVTGVGHMSPHVTTDACVSHASYADTLSMDLYGMEMGGRNRGSHEAIRFEVFEGDCELGRCTVMSPSLNRNADAKVAMF